MRDAGNESTEYSVQRIQRMKREARRGKACPGGQTVETGAPLDRSPVFARNGYALP